MTKEKREPSWIKYPLVAVAAIAAVLLIGVFAVKILQPLLPAKWTARTPIEYVERTTGAKVRDAKLVFHEDTHGGFHGDGDTFMAFDCSEAGEEFESSLSAWRELPMSDKLYYALFDQRADMGEPLGRLFARFDIGYDHDTPAVKDGLYYFANRHNKAKSRDDENLSFHSWNFTFAVYDRETKKLYYMEVDT